ncbi:hypothetical protein GCM10008935_19280 [Alkalibacillus silvisoli]|uniref:IS256 family transposase n=1 Tax=Alkalibacillus silvisoli TaxID=392823 RepID=A0ABP3JTG3_9BACI
MTQLQFNLDMGLLKDSVVNSDMEEVIKTAIVLLLNEYMEKERDEYLKVPSYERFDYRNGYYERKLVSTFTDN